MTMRDDPQYHLEEESLHAYLDGALAESEADGVAAHLSACPVCQAELMALRALFTTLDSLEEVPLARDLAAPVVAQLAAEGAWAPVTTRRWLTWLWLAQGVVALGLAIMLWPALTTWWETVATAGLASSLATLSAWYLDWRVAADSWVAGLETVLGVWRSQQPLFDLPPDRLLILSGLILFAWLAGNGVLLRPVALRRRHPLNGGSHG